VGIRNWIRILFNIVVDFFHLMRLRFHPLRLNITWKRQPDEGRKNYPDRNQRLRKQHDDFDSSAVRIYFTPEQAKLSKIFPF
jgi:hypothetical protein